MKRVIIELEVSEDKHPDTGIAFSKNNFQEQVYQYLHELMDDKSLSFRVVDESDSVVIVPSGGCSSL